MEDARVGLAGPIWGAGACLVAALLFHATDIALLAAAARIGAWINLFNLLPVWSLDGSRGFSAMSRRGRGMAAGALLVAWLIAGDGMILLVAIVAGARVFVGQAPPESDRRTVMEYCGLALLLALMFRLPVPMP